MSRHWLIAFGLGLALAAPAQAESVVYGRVFQTMENTVFTDAKVTLLSNPPKQTRTDQYGQYWLRDVKPGAYLVRLQIPGRPLITGRLVVGKGTTVANLDLSKIGHPDHDEEY
ncbi:carboxypeptidase-like regulatory domain-containing protein [Gloeobacter morelensis]|uniref:Carboxypeptidase regulatory-like domain-containing protein n=1 Tax=Gloeobacter morelensis MG652769 TaxID=2781736 RepID=A0ABY3PIB9_9CYAN|nr:carboxypeptidase-like regulatory domain-containing protein [Gloeobacter morelensis]UFP93406.1 carboxypeptidase regulatory-like domain-containing protein [Gloeobacter morelensis MG652769]